MQSIIDAHNRIASTAPDPAMRFLCKFGNRQDTASHALDAATPDYTRSQL